MKRGGIYTAGLVLTLFLTAIATHAQNSPAHRAGCQNAEDLNGQATSVIGDIQKITRPDDSQSETNNINDLAKRVNNLRAELGYCFTEEVGKDEDAAGALRNPSQKLRMIMTTADYLDFVHETRWGKGDKSFLAGLMPSDVEQKIPECKGVVALQSEADNFITHVNSDADNLMPHDVESLYHRAKELIDCGSALEKSSDRAAAAQLYLLGAGIDNLMVLADSNSEAVLIRALATPVSQPRQPQPMQPQPIIIRSGPRTCTGHAWGDENYRTIDWSCN
ncbi:MAG: hypothetical protein ACRD33_08935 [Candidatus Acidiferrales bacterium]